MTRPVLPFSEAMDGVARPPGNALRALALVGVFVLAFALLPRIFRHKMVGRDAPDFALPVVANGAGIGSPNADGKTLSLSELRGQAVLLDFWATWCRYCRAAAPALDRASRRWRDRGVVVVGVDTDAPGEGDPRSFAIAHGLSYPIVQDQAGRATRTYEVDGLPTLVVVSREGKVVAVHTGVTDDGELDRLIGLAL